MTRYDDDIEIICNPVITAPCKCGRGKLVQVTNGWFHKAFFCPVCENVYQMKLVNVPVKKVAEEFLKQCRKAVECNK